MNNTNKENSTVNEIYIGSFFEEYHIKKQEGFKDVKIEQLGFTFRTELFLQKIKCYTVWDLLSLSEIEISRVRNMGKKNVREIVEMIVSISHTKEFIGESNADDVETINIKRMIVEDLLNGNFLNQDQLSQIEYQSKFYMKIDNTIKLLGREFCSVAYYEPDELVPVMRALNKFSKETDEIYAKKQTFYECYNNVNKMWLSLPITPLIMAYSQNSKVLYNLLDVFQNTENVMQIPNVLEIILKNRVTYEVVCDFLRYLSVSLTDIIEKINERIFIKENYKVVIESKAKGMSLGDIGEILSISRERVRQIGIKVEKLFLKVDKKYPLIWIMSALLQGAETIKDDYLINNFGEYGFIYCCILKNTKSLYYTYNKRLKMFMLCEDKTEQIEEFVLGMPDTIRCEEHIEQIHLISVNQDLPLELLERVFYEQYKLIGTIYCKKNMSLKDMYDYIILHYYPHGIKLFANGETEKLKLLLTSVFGDIKMPNTNRAIDAQISNIAVLCDNGTYIHPSHVYLPNELLQKIDGFIEKNERNTFTFLELFNIFKEELLLGSNINNKYFLKGALTLYLSDKYYFRKGFVSKSSEASID